MHVTAGSARYITRGHVTVAKGNSETEIINEKELNKGNHAKIVEKMVEGRLGKFFEGICLLEQKFVKDPDMKVQKFVESKNASIKDFVRYEVGEGIEKKTEDFAEEVMSQMK